MNEKLKVTAVIQARMGSSRLPGKSMLPICGKPLLAHVINRVKAIKNINNIIIATSYTKKNEVIVDLAYKMNCTVITGSEENVLERFLMIEKLYNPDYILRITGDNPLIDPYHADNMIKEALFEKCDLMDMGEIPIGIGVEIIRSTALHDSNREIDKIRSLEEKKGHLEHVTTFIKRNPQKYKYITFPCGINNPFKNIHFTVDYKNEYKFVKTIYEKLYKNNNIFSIEDILNLLKTDNTLIK
jgi:spore coat polysaccharide biosynthesis protein SpsF